MGARLVRICATLTVVACSACLPASPGPPTKATVAQVEQMNLEFSGGSTGFGVAPDWPAIMKSIRSATNAADRQHWISEFAYHTAALPESLRTVRLAELQQLMREGR